MRDRKTFQGIAFRMILLRTTNKQNEEVISMMDMVKKLYNDEEGATMVEYALMVALIAIACIVAVQALGGKVSNKFDQVGNSL
jgi:pilus assembly protein Flp/PilA